MDEDDKSSLIVVGVDGSDASKEALRWAAREASCTGGRIEAVLAWTFPPYTGIGIVTDDFDYQGRAREVLESSITEAFDSTRPPNLHTSVVQGNAARVLIDASRNAALLVVGNRGYGGFSEALLGSVGQHCTQHAVCPVVVIRGDRT